MTPDRPSLSRAVGSPPPSDLPPTSGRASDGTGLAPAGAVPTSPVYRWCRDMTLDDPLVAGIANATTEEDLRAALAAREIEPSDPWVFALGVLQGAVRQLRRDRDELDPEVGR